MRPTNNAAVGVANGVVLAAPLWVVIVCVIRRLL